jgi:hypothetical protein
MNTNPTTATPSNYTARRQARTENLANELLSNEVNMLDRRDKLVASAKNITEFTGCAVMKFIPPSIDYAQQKR